MASSPPKSESDSSGRFWRSLREMLFGDASGPTLREQIEEVIDEADEDRAPSASADGAFDLSSVEREMLRNMLHFGEKTVDDVAVPRGDIVAISADASFKEAVAIFAEADHSRLPLYSGGLDNIVGMLHVKDLFGILARGEQPPKALADMKREPLYVPQAMNAIQLLVEMRARRTHLAIVLDEYGGTEGLVTIEDLVEEIVGDIEDEYDEAPEVLLHVTGDGTWEGDARIELDDLAEAIDPRLAETDDDVETLGGLAFELAGHVPAVGEVLHHPSGWELTILDGDERRVTRVGLRHVGDREGEGDH